MASTNITSGVTSGLLSQLGAGDYYAHYDPHTHTYKAVPTQNHAHTHNMERTYMGVPVGQITSLLNNVRGPESVKGAIVDYEGYYREFLRGLAEYFKSDIMGYNQTVTAPTQMDYFPQMNTEDEAIKWLTLIELDDRKIESFEIQSVKSQLKRFAQARLDVIRATQEAAVQYDKTNV